MRIALGAGLLVMFLVNDGNGRGPTSIPLRFDGLLQPAVTLELGIPVEGRLDGVFVKRGDRIDPGDVIARLDCSVDRASLRVAEAKATGDAAELTAGVNVELYADKVEQVTLLFTKGIASQEEMTEAVTNFRLAELELKQAQQTREVARLEAARVRAQLEQRQIVSRVSGVVVECHLSEGELVTGAKASVARVAVLDPLRVELIVSSDYFGKIAPGTKGRVTIPGFDFGSVDATVSIVDRVIDASSGTLGIQLEVANPDHRIPAGVECTVEFEESR